MPIAVAAAPDSPMPPRRGPRWKRWLKRIVLGAFALIILLALTGFSYNAMEQRADARRFPQQGKSVALGPAFPGVSLNIDCSGQGSPTVILDSGLGVPAAGWDFVQPAVAKFTRVCSYDRAGYGWSIPDPMPRTSAELVRELHALLATAFEQTVFATSADEVRASGNSGDKPFISTRAAACTFRPARRCAFQSAAVSSSHFSPRRKWAKARGSAWLRLMES
jgi:hypothetical protein